MALSVDKENKQNVRMTSWILAFRLLAVSLVVGLMSDADVLVTPILGIMLSLCVIAFLLLRRNCWLQYCYLAAACFWAECGATLYFNKVEGLVLPFVICLIVVDATTFVTLWKRVWP